MAKAAKEALGADEIDVIADMGYYHGQQVKECLEDGITPYIPKANTSANRKSKIQRSVLDQACSQSKTSATSRSTTVTAVQPVRP